MSRKQLKNSVPLADASAGLRASLRPPELRNRRRLLLEALDHEDDPEAHLQLAFLDYMTHDFDGARVHAETAYREFRSRGSRRRAAVAAAAVGRIHFEGYNNLPAARGWFARGRTMLADEGDCVERGWVELGLVGCSVPDVSVLAVKAAAAVELARRFDDIDLECKALADQGLALVSMGRIDEGMELIDEAMAIVSTGDVLPFAAGQVGCCTLSACERAGDLPRADAWLRALERAGVARPDDMSPILFAHCQGAYGSLLCVLGRWSEAETALSMSLTTGRGGFFTHLVLARGALADLRTRQGRFEEADRLLAECGDRWEAMPPRAGLHFARGEFDHAAALVKQALRQVGEDRVRVVPLLALLVRVELGRANVEAARTAADRSTAMAEEVGAPQLIAEAALARGRVCAATGDLAGAVADYEGGLQAISRTDNLLIRAALHHDLARALAAQDTEAAISEARSALAIYGGLDAPEAEQCASLLRGLGVTISYTPTPPVSPLSQLSRREREVLQLVAQGMSNPEIATRLFISPKTAEHHVSSILSKLGLRSRVEVRGIDPALV
jgi:ATP/maltotriose-dependent transcriptional regulator MalT